MKNDIKNAIIGLFLALLIIIIGLSIDSIKNMDFLNIFKTDHKSNKNEEEIGEKENKNDIISKDAKSLQIILYVDDKTEELTLYEEVSNQRITSKNTDKVGYYFLGWSISRDSKNIIYLPNEVVGDKIINNYNDKLVLYAVFEAKSYNITFDCNGGSNPPDKQVVKYNEDYTLTGLTCKKNGYYQQGWIDENNKNIDPNNYVNVKYTKTSDMKLKANWISISNIVVPKKYSITFDCNGGTNTPVTQVAEENKKFTLSNSVCIRAGYTQDGWTDQDNNAWKISNKTNIKWTYTKNIKLKAKWIKKELKITFNINGGKGTNNQTQTFVYGKDNQTITDKKISRTGYSLLGWSFSSTAASEYFGVNGKMDDNIISNYSPSLTLYAVWKPKTYTVSFDCNGGSGNIKSQSATYGKTFTITSSTCTRSGYIQNGWIDQNNVSWTTSNTNNWTWTYKYDVVLKAVWIEKNNKIHFINTGNSDAFLIESNGHYGLIDASNPSMSDNICTSNSYNARQHPSVSSDKVSNCISSCSSRVSTDKRTSIDHVIKYLNSVGVSKLDFIIATHNHADHIGGIKTLAESKYVTSDTNYYYRSYVLTSEDYLEPSWCNYEFYLRALESLKKKSATLVEVTSKTPEFNFGDYKIKILNTSPASSDEMTTISYDGRSIKTTNGDNKNSLVTLLKYNNKKVLFNGDMEIEDEIRLVNNNSSDISNVDVLKMGHHGGRTSTDIKFAKKTNPDYIIIPTNSLNTGKNYGSIRYLEKSNKTTTYYTGKVDDAIVLSFKSDNEYTFTNSDNKTNISNAKIGLRISDIDGNTITSIKNGWEKLTYKVNSSDQHVWLYYDNNEFIKKWKQIRYNNKDSWFYFDPISGVMQKGWIKDNGNWYYLDSEGVMKTGWLQLSGYWYYLNSSGKMLTGTQVINGETFVFNSSGVCIEGRGC